MQSLSIQLQRRGKHGQISITFVPTLSFVFPTGYAYIRTRMCYVISSSRMYSLDIRFTFCRHQDMEQCGCLRVRARVLNSDSRGRDFPSVGTRIMHTHFEAQNCLRESFCIPGFRRPTPSEDDVRCICLALLSSTLFQVSITV